MSWDLNPLNWGRSNVPVRRQGYQPSSPADRFFDDFFNLDYPNPSMGRDFIPSLDVSEDAREVRVECELPGMDEKDIDVSLSGNVLTIQGEKRSEEESKERGVHRRERRYGAFLRTVELPQGLDLDSVDACFKNGVLCVTLPKTEEFRQRVRNIPIGGRTETSMPPERERSYMSDRERAQMSDRERAQMSDRDRAQMSDRERAQMSDFDRAPISDLDRTDLERNQMSEPERMQAERDRLQHERDRIDRRDSPLQ